MKFITPRYMHQNAIFFPCEKSFVVNFAIAMIEFAAQKLGMQNLVEILFERAPYSRVWYFYSFLIPKDKYTGNLLKQPT